MKLWKCSAHCDNDTYFKLLVAETEEEARSRWEVDVEDELTYGTWVEEVKVVGGYQVILMKK